MEWTPKRAARLGWLAGRGVSMRAVLQDRYIGITSEQQLRNIGTRWGLTFGKDKSSPSLAIPVPPADQEILEQAAQERGLSAASFAADLLHVITRERLFAAVMDDDRD